MPCNLDYTHTHIRTHIPPGFWAEGGHIGSKWAKAMFFGVGTIPLERACFSMKPRLWHSKPAFDDFHDISCPPLKRASWLNDFTFYSFLWLFSGPISPIYSFLRCFYRAHKPEPKKVTKSYVWVTFELRKVTKSYKKLRLSYEKVMKSYKKLWKITNELPNNFL